MEIHLSPDIQAKLDQMAADSNTKTDQLIEFALEGYFLDGENGSCAPSR